MLGFSRLEIIRRLILLITGVMIAFWCFNPTIERLYDIKEPRSRLRFEEPAWEPPEDLFPEAPVREPAWRPPKDLFPEGPIVPTWRRLRFGVDVDDVPGVAFRCIGTAVIGGVLFYILGGKKERKG